MKIVQEITLDVLEKNGLRVFAKQNDQNSRFLKINITKQGERIDIPPNCTAGLAMTRADFQKKTFKAEINADGSVSVLLPKWLLAEEGIASCDIVIVQGEETLTTLKFLVVVEKTSCPQIDYSQDDESKEIYFRNLTIDRLMVGNHGEYTTNHIGADGKTATSKVVFGNGTEEKKSNALEIFDNGDIVTQGEIYIRGARVLTTDEDLNIVNSEGVGSLVRKSFYINMTADDGTVTELPVLGGTASGVGSIILGGLRYDKLDNLSDTIIPFVPGNQSLSLNAGCVAYGDFDISAGKECVTYQRCAFAFGGESQAGLPYEEYKEIAKRTSYERYTATEKLYNEKTYIFGMAVGEQAKACVRNSNAFGYKSYAGGSCDFVVGNNCKTKLTLSQTANFVSGSNNNIISGSWNLVGGCGNSLSGKANLLSGESNKIITSEGAQLSCDNFVGGVFNSLTDSHRNIVNGKSNILTAASYSLINGIGNKILTSYSIVDGDSNTVAADYSLILGKGNENKGSYSGLIGRYLVNNNTDSLLVGKYNDTTDENAQFVVANGTSNANRKNNFVVYKDGNAKLAGTLTVNGQEVATKSDIVKEIVTLDLLTILDNQDVKTILDLSKRYVKGEIEIVVSLSAFGATGAAVVTNVIYVDDESESHRATWSAMSIGSENIEDSDIKDGVLTAHILEVRENTLVYGTRDYRLPESDLTPTKLYKHRVTIYNDVENNAKILLPDGETCAPLELCFILYSSSKTSITISDIINKVNHNEYLEGYVSWEAALDFEYDYLHAGTRVLLVTFDDMYVEFYDQNGTPFAMGDIHQEGLTNAIRVWDSVEEV